MNGVRRVVSAALAAIVAALALGTSGAGATPAAFPAATGRILVPSEWVFGLRLTLLDTSGRPGSQIGAPFGVRLGSRLVTPRPLERPRGDA